MTKLDRLFTDCLAEGRFAGASALVRQRGVLVWRGDFGFRDREKELNVDGDSIFRLASMTKPVIAVAVMILAERGLLDIDDPVSRYLPAFSRLQAADRAVSFADVLEFDPENAAVPRFNLQKLEGIGTVPVCRPLTIRHLLGHCGGMGQGPYSNGIYDSGIRPDQTLAERVDWMARVPLDTQPGDCAGYSAGMGFDVLGRIVELVSGKDLNRFIREEICAPLQIADLGYALTAEQRERLARLYEAESGRLRDVTESDAAWQIVDPLPRGYYSGSAGMLGSLNAYDRFASMLAGGGELDGVRLLRPETAAAMAVNSSPKKLEMSPGIGWGLGMIVHEDPQRSGRHVSPGSFGWSGRYGCHFFIDPVRQISAVMTMGVSNIGGADSPIARAFEDAIWEEFS